MSYDIALFWIDHKYCERLNFIKVNSMRFFVGGGGGGGVGGF